MARKKNLVAVFMPPLAAMLARAEDVKGSRLTQEEVERIRDAAPCITMEPADAKQMEASRGFRDVNPEDCWADWHRLRVEMTGNGYLPKIVLCLLGDEDLPGQCQPILESEGAEHEWREHDRRMVRAFKASACRFDPSLTREDLANIKGHSRVLYVLSKNFTAQEAPVVSRAFLRLGGRLLEAGGTALKCESSGIAHGRERWLELARESENENFWSALFRAYVQYPIQNGDDYHSTGLHLLGQPDLIVSSSLLREAAGSKKDPAWAAVDLFLGFALYLLSECAPGQFASGHTFSLNADSPRFRVLWEECTGYDEDEFFYNPFGRWRFAEWVR